MSRGKETRKCIQESRKKKMGLKRENLNGSGILDSAKKHGYLPTK